MSIEICQSTSSIVGTGEADTTHLIRFRRGRLVFPCVLPNRRGNCA